MLPVDIENGHHLPVLNALKSSSLKSISKKRAVRCTVDMSSIQDVTLLFNTKVFCFKNKVKHDGMSFLMIHCGLRTVSKNVAVRLEKLEDEKTEKTKEINI